MDTEIPLTGGNSNAGVVKVGNTVRRAVGSSSATTHRLLEFLQAHGYAGSPRFLGIDDKGREILSYIPGCCENFADAWKSEAILLSAARQLRDLHDITASCPVSADDAWGYVYPDSTRHQVICHNDYGLYNLVIRNDECVGVIDFDLAGPGPRLRDIAYGAYWLAPVSQRAQDMRPFALTDLDDGCRRLRLFCETCGVRLDADLLDMLGEVLGYMADKQAMIDAIGDAQTAQLEQDGHLDFWAGEAAAFEEYRAGIADRCFGHQ